MNFFGFYFNIKVFLPVYANTSTFNKAQSLENYILRNLKKNVHLLQEGSADQLTIRVANSARNFEILTN
jgi:hypothetical protein